VSAALKNSKGKYCYIVDVEQKQLFYLIKRGTTSQSIPKVSKTAQTAQKLAMEWWV